MLFCIKIFNCFEVKKRVCCFLIVLCILHSHPFEIFCSPFCNHYSRYNVKNNRDKSNHEKFPWIYVIDYTKNKYEFNKDWQKTKTCESKNGSKRLGSSLHNPNDFTSLSRKMESQTLVLYMVVD